MSPRDRLAALLHETGTCWNEEFGCDGSDDHLNDADRLLANGVTFGIDVERLARALQLAPWDPTGLIGWGTRGSAGTSAPTWPSQRRLQEVAEAIATEYDIDRLRPGAER